MKRTILVTAIACLMAVVNVASATIDIFGTGSNQFTIDFVNISGDTNPTSGYGIVNNDYRIGTYEITNDQWDKFTNIYGTPIGGLTSAYDQSAYWTGEDVPTTGVSWYEAAQFVNYLNTSKGYHAAYKFTGTQGTSDYALYKWSAEEAAGGTNLTRHKDAMYYLPTEDEWVKAAYWNGTTLQTYATIGDSLPVAGLDTNYDYVIDQPWDVGSGSGELNGTFDMMGNVSEWIELHHSDISQWYGPGTPFYLPWCDHRGGKFSSGDYALPSSTWGTSTSNSEYKSIGFRVASIPEPQTYYVDADAAGNNNGSSWDDAFNYLQDALAAAQSADEIWVAQGKYTPDANTANPNGTGDREATFQLKNAVAVKGGYAGYGEPDPNARDIELYETILSGDLVGNDGPDFANNDENSYHVVTGSGTDETALLDGLTITAGNANGSSTYKYNTGGGMYNYEDASPTLTNCTFRGNLARTSGGGMYNRSTSNLTHPTLTNCTFHGNYADSGGAIMFRLGYAESTTVLTNCIFSGNSALWFGGGIDNIDSNLTLNNCTFVGNWVEMGTSGAMRITENSRQTITNCIFWANRPDPFGGDVGDAWIRVTYSLMQDGWYDEGKGNIDADPQFVDPCNSNYHLLPGSPCIDAGDNTAVPAGVTTDLDGNPRFVDQPEVPDTGNGTAPIVDMGAFEADYIEVSMKFTPQALNLSSGGRLVKAHFVLPEGFSVEDVDANTPAVIAYFGVKSYNLSVLLNDEGLVRVEATFRRSDLCSSITGYDDNIEVMVIGRLTTGQQFYGTDIIKITDRAFDHLAIFVSYWLEGDCFEPDWCDGADLNTDSVVNFLDFALLDRCCIEVTEE